MILHAGKYRPFTVDDFPRISTYEQQYALYRNPEISRRGPSLLWSLHAFKPENDRHPCGNRYRLSDESES
jgi:hypothetical protein